LLIFACTKRPFPNHLISGVYFKKPIMAKPAFKLTANSKTNFAAKMKFALQWLAFKQAPPPFIRCKVVKSSNSGFKGFTVKTAKNIVLLTDNHIVGCHLSAIKQLGSGYETQRRFYRYYAKCNPQKPAFYLILLLRQCFLPVRCAAAVVMEFRFTFKFLFSPLLNFEHNTTWL
jgi:hypothetical protein